MAAALSSYNYFVSISPLKIINNRLLLPTIKPTFATTFTSLPRLSWTSLQHRRVVCVASSAAGSSSSDSDVNPYELKMAYDKIMMSQLNDRKKGVTFGSFEVSKDIKYADKMPFLPWGPRFSKSSVNDNRINLAISAVFTVWIFVVRNAEWKPFQFLSAVFVYRIFEKLKAFEPDTSPTVTENSENDDGGRGLRMGKRLLRSLSLVLGCVAVASLGYTGLLNLIEMSGKFIPAVLYNNQELFVTASTSALLYILATYYR